MNQHITECVATWAQTRPNDHAIIDVRESSTCVWSWSKVCREMLRISDVLLDLGVQSGETVAYQLPNRTEFVAITLAILRIGGICCPLMPFFRERELLSILNRARPRVLFVPNEFRGRRYIAEFKLLAPRLETVEHIIVVTTGESKAPIPNTEQPTWVRLYGAIRSIRNQPSEFEQRRTRLDAVAQLLFTSGTSGLPKGVLHRHDILMKAAVMHAERSGMQARDTIFVPSPMAHQTGFLYGMWLALMLGIPQITQAIWDPQRALRALREWHATFLQAAPTFVSDLVYAAESGIRAPSSLRMVVPTGASPSPSLVRRAEHVLHTRICGAFGTTEGCLATLSAPTDSLASAAMTDGSALPGVSLRICDGEDHVLSTGTEGHLQTSSPTMFAGYLDDPELTARAYTADGWYRTGDLATIDSDGYLHVTGRINDIINRGGEKIPLQLVEQLLQEHPAVREVAIVAMPDARLGERACAFVVTNGSGGIGFYEMQRFLHSQGLAKPYWPERLELIEELPKTESGKVQRYLLRERAKTLGPFEAPVTFA